MKKNLFANFEILILFSFFSLICLQRIQFSPLNNDFDEEEFNPINGLFGINNMAKNLINAMNQGENDLEDPVDDNKNNLVTSKPKKQRNNSKRGRTVRIEETRSKNGMQRKVIRDLGNGMKSVEITEVMNAGGVNKNLANDMFNPFSNRNIGMPIPTIIIEKKNLKKNGSPRINPINIFNELDEMFENFFVNVADSFINNQALERNGQNKTHLHDDDHIDLDEIDLSLNETHHNEPQLIHNQHQDHIKLNYIKDANTDTHVSNNENNNSNKNLIETKSDQKIVKSDNEQNALIIRSQTTNSISDKTVTDSKKDDTRAAIRDRIVKQKLEEKKNKKLRNPIFVKICKFLFYFICLVSFYIIIMKLLVKYGFIIHPNLNETEKSINTIKGINTNTKANNNNSDEIPLKHTEITEIKQSNKND